MRTASQELHNCRKLKMKVPIQQEESSQIGLRLFLVNVLTISTILSCCSSSLMECRPLDDGRQLKQNSILDEATTLSANFERLFRFDRTHRQKHNNHHHHHRKHHAHNDQYPLRHHLRLHRRHHRRSLHAVVDASIDEKHVPSTTRKLSTANGRKHRRSGGGNRLMLTKPYWPWP
uniref:Uncharacterized protein n=1 Tax=Globodera rostochiensis TaxID=31243 RepID=A0A914I5B7_GLORO